MSIVLPNEMVYRNNYEILKTFSVMWIISATIVSGGSIVRGSCDVVVQRDNCNVNH